MLSSPVWLAPFSSVSEQVMSEDDSIIISGGIRTLILPSLGTGFVAVITNANTASL